MVEQYIGETVPGIQTPFGSLINVMTIQDKYCTSSNI